MSAGELLGGVQGGGLDGDEQLPGLLTKVMLIGWTIWAASVLWLAGCTGATTVDDSGTTTDTASPDPPLLPVCTDPQLDTSDGGIGDPCTVHDECADDRFCGAGHCRPLDKPITVCIEYAKFGGSWDEDSAPDSHASISDQGGYDGDYSGSILWTDVIHDSYMPVWRMCEQWAHTNSAAIEIGMAELDDEAPWSTGIVTARWRDNFPTGSQVVDFFRLVGEGCVEVPNDNALKPDLRARLYISLWYP